MKPTRSGVSRPEARPERSVEEAIVSYRDMTPKEALAIVAEIYDPYVGLNIGDVGSTPVVKRRLFALWHLTELVHGVHGVDEKCILCEQCYLRYALETPDPLSPWRCAICQEQKEERPQ